MAIQYYDGNQWVDYEAQGSGIKIYRNGRWVDGADNKNSPAVSVHRYNNGKWLQMYPTGKITYTDTFTASNLKFIHSQSNSFATDTNRPNGDAKGGIWTSGAIYTGWLNLTPTTCPVSVGRGNVKDIEDITVRYNRRGVGNYEIDYPLALVLSTMLKPTLGGYTVHHSSKAGNTFYTDTGMNTLPPGSTGGEVAGVATMNNQNAFNMMKYFMNTSTYSILLGYKESTNTPFIGLYGLDIDVTYTSVVYRATFPNIPSSYKMEMDKDGNVEMWLFEDELDLSFEEIMERRKKSNRAMVEPSKVNIEVVSDIKEKDIKKSTKKTTKKSNKKSTKKATRASNE